MKKKQQNKQTLLKWKKLFYKTSFDLQQKDYEDNGNKIKIAFFYYKPQMYDTIRHQNDTKSFKNFYSCKEIQ